MEKKEELTKTQTIYIVGGRRMFDNIITGEAEGEICQVWKVEAAKRSHVGQEGS